MVIIVQHFIYNINPLFINSNYLNNKIWRLATYMYKKIVGIIILANIFLSIVIPTTVLPTPVNDVPWWDAAYSSIAAAYTDCVANRGDIIICKKGAHSITETITCNKAGVTIMAQDVGMNPINQGQFVFKKSLVPITARVTPGSLTPISVNRLAI